LVLPEHHQESAQVLVGGDDLHATSSKDILKAVGGLEHDSSDDEEWDVDA
jgi:hypothetical protein